MLTALHMSLTAKELLTNWHEIHFVSTQLGTLVIQHLLLNISSAFCSFYLKTVAKSFHSKAYMPLNIWKLNLITIIMFIIILQNYQWLLNN